MKTLTLLLNTPMRNTHHPHRAELRTTSHHHHLEDTEETAGVGNNLTDSLRYLVLSLRSTEREVRVSFRQLSRIYHPDKHKPEQTGLTQREAIEKFQLINKNLI
jgi:hypothetical protein